MLYLPMLHHLTIGSSNTWSDMAKKLESKNIYRCSNLINMIIRENNIQPINVFISLFLNFSFAFCSSKMVSFVLHKIVLKLSFVAMLKKKKKIVNLQKISIIISKIMNVLRENQFYSSVFIQFGCNKVANIIVKC